MKKLSAFVAMSAIVLASSAQVVNQGPGRLTGAIGTGGFGMHDIANEPYFDIGKMGTDPMPAMKDSELVYKVSVDKAGQYYLYLQLGAKIKGDDALNYDIIVNGDESNTVTRKESIQYGGNFNTYFIDKCPVNLIEGENTIKIIARTGRTYYCYLYEQGKIPLRNDFLIDPQAATSLESLPVTINALTAHPSSTDIAYTSIAAFKVDNSGYGDNNAVLITNKVITDQPKYEGDPEVQGKAWSYLQPSKRRYLIDVPTEGAYKVTMNGYFVFNRAKIEETWQMLPIEINNFTLNFDGKAESDDTSLFSEIIEFPTITETYPGITEQPYGSPDKGIPNPAMGLLGGWSADFGVSKVINLPAGRYFLELSTPYDENNFYFLRNIIIDSENAVIPTYCITVEQGENGVIAPANPDADITAIEKGSSVVFTITPNEGYLIDTISVDGDPITVTNENGQNYTFGAIEADHTITATFKEKPQAQRVPVPGELTEFSEDNSFYTNGMLSVGAYVEYALNIAEAGDYVLYLTAGSKDKRNGAAVKFDVLINGEIAATYDAEKADGGNWNVFTRVAVPITLPQGDVAFRIVSQSNRWSVKNDPLPAIIKADAALAIDEPYPVALNLLSQHASSSSNFTSIAGFNIDNGLIGPKDDKCVLVTGMDFSYNEPAKFQSPFPATKLRYLIDVKTAGEYNMTLSGKFCLVDYEDAVIAPAFNVNLKAISAENDTEVASGVVTFDEVAMEGNLTKRDEDYSVLTTDMVSAEGSIRLPAGKYFLEISTDCFAEHYLFLYSFNFNQPTPYRIKLTADVVGEGSIMGSNPEADLTKGVWYNDLGGDLITVVPAKGFRLTNLKIDNVDVVADGEYLGAATNDEFNVHGGETVKVNNKGVETGDLTINVAGINLDHHFLVHFSEYSGIEDVTTENNVQAEYFNLQGVRVEKPGKGLYIVVRGDKVTKTVIK